MHPNPFLRSLWRPDTLEQVFVAMPFVGERFTNRYKEVILPAIEGEPLEGRTLSAYRVDNSASGDSILTDIVDGIVHSALVLADVSMVDRGRDTDRPVRNGNVMYEVGVALAARSPSEVLLIRDDSEPFLFDVSSIPHMTLDFSNPSSAISELRKALLGRIKETRRVAGALVEIALRSLTEDEARILSFIARFAPTEAVDLSGKLGLISIPDERGIRGLLQKGAVRATGRSTQSGGIFYTLTPFGRHLNDRLRDGLPLVAPTSVRVEPSDVSEDAERDEPPRPAGS